MAHITKRENILERPTFAWAIAFLILFSIVCFSAETLPGLSPSAISFLKYSEIVVVGLFTVEYLYRLWQTEKRLNYIFSFYGLIDLFAILPFYLATTLDLRSLRLLRLLRLARLLKLVRYNAAMKRFAKALNMVKEELTIFGIASLMMLYLAAVGIYHFEHAAQPEVFESILDCLWWAVATLTTVGYGDVYPITAGGRLFTFVILMLGLGMVAVPTGIVASALSEVRRKES